MLNTDASDDGLGDILHHTVRKLRISIAIWRKRDGLMEYGKLPTGGRIMDQPNKAITDYLHYKQQHDRDRRKMLHRNMVLFIAISASKPDLLDTSVLIDSTLLNTAEPVDMI